MGILKYNMQYLSEYLSSYLLQKSHRVGIVGCTGSGKTAILHEIMSILTTYPRKIIYDPHDEFNGHFVKDRRELYNNLKQPYSTTRYRNPALRDYAHNLLLKGGNTLYITDEAQQIFPSRKAPESSLRLIREGRHFHIPMIWATQRPTTCHTDLLGNTSMLFVGRLLAPADKQYVRGYGITEIPDNYNFYVVIPDRNEPIIIKSKKFN